jgi:hypothetical protein
MATAAEREVALLEVGCVDGVVTGINEHLCSERVTTFTQCAYGLESDLVTAAKVCATIGRQRSASTLRSSSLHSPATAGSS